MCNQKQLIMTWICHQNSVKVIKVSGNTMKVMVSCYKCVVSLRLSFVLLFVSLFHITNCYSF